MSKNIIFNGIGRYLTRGPYLTKGTRMYPNYNAHKYHSNSPVKNNSRHTIGYTRCKLDTKYKGGYTKYKFGATKFQNKNKD